MTPEDRQAARDLLRQVSLWMENHENSGMPNIYEFCYGTKRILESENQQLTRENAEKFLSVGQQFSYFLSAWEGAIDSAKALKKELENVIED